MTVFFTIFTLLLLGTAYIVAFNKNLLRSAFALFGVLFSVAGFYAMLGADFLAIVQLMVYAGGINILLIFGTMLTHDVSVNVEESNPSSWSALPVVAGLLTFGTIVAVFVTTAWPTKLFSTYEPTTEGIGELLLSKFVLPFEVVSFLLLAAMVGALVIIIHGNKGR